MVDRKKLKNPNGLILGTPGSGKSFSAKREIANCFLLTSDDVIICDPEAEYAPLVERLHGQVIKISPTSTNYINPMDLNLDYSDDESPLSLMMYYGHEDVFEARVQQVAPERSPWHQVRVGLYVVDAR